MSSFYTVQTFLNNYNSHFQILVNFDEFLGKVMEEQMSKPFDLLLGRKTYEIFASYWPHHKDEDPGINQATKYITSHRAMQFTWDKSILLQGDMVEAIKNLKRRMGLNYRFTAAATSFKRF
jgi:dihydrofolate reductase